MRPRLCCVEPRLVLLAVLVGAGLWSGGCGSDSPARLLVAETSGFVTLQQGEKRAVGVRYLDQQGTPVQGAVRFRLEGNLNGALIDAVVARTDAMGVARTQLTAGSATSLVLVAAADGAAELRIGVTVSQDAGGELQVQLLADALAGRVDRADLILTDDLTCATFDPRRPPAGAGGPVSSKLQAYLSQVNSAAVSFRGLRADRTYAVVAVAMLAAQVVGKGCASGISMTQQEVDAKLPKQVNVSLEAVAPEDPPLGDDELVVTTRLTHPPKLGAAAALLDQLAADPVGLVMQKALAKAGTSQAWVAALTAAEAALLTDLRQKMPYVQAVQTKFKAVADALKQVTELQLITTLEVADEANDQLTAWQATHNFEYFTARVGSLTRNFRLAGSGLGMFPVPSGAPAPAPLVLSAPTTMRKDGVSTSLVIFEPHTLSLPVGEALLATLLIDQFNDYQVLEILRSQLDCLAAGQLSRAYYDSSVKGSEGALVEQGMREGCEAILTTIAHQLHGELVAALQDAGLDEQVELQGRASLSRGPDGKISQLTSGRWGPLDNTNSWSEIGTFSARRGTQP